MAFIGIDVGTGSVRAGVFDATGQLLGSAAQDIAIFREAGGIVEQSSKDIWAATCVATKAALTTSGLDAKDINGLGFDATCSLVVLNADGASLPVGQSDDPARDVIVWMDHRAVEQATRINAGTHKVLDYVGGQISPEMQMPKLLWLKENRPEIFAHAGHFFDLSDFLGWRATGSTARSICTVVCKWTYLAHEARWDAAFFKDIGLEELTKDRFSRIGATIVPPGTPLADGLTETSAKELGLRPGTPVGAGLIDAHAGGIGTVGSAGDDPTQTMAYVFGTSSCTMTSVAKPTFVPGVWGPYHSAMVPDLWLLEGGQSAAGAAIDRLLMMHPAFGAAQEKARTMGQSLPEWLAGQARAQVDTPGAAVSLAKGLHIVPEFLGNRAPFADPHARAMIAGLGIDDGIQSLITLYVAGICAIGYGLRQIIEAQAQHGAKVAQIVISGGAGRDPLVRQILADATGLPVIIPQTGEPVLLGSAMIAALASDPGKTLGEVMATMSRPGKHMAPSPSAVLQRHEQRFQVFEQLQRLGQSRDLRDF